MTERDPQWDEELMEDAEDFAMVEDPDDLPIPDDPDDYIGSDELLPGEIPDVEEVEENMAPPLADPAGGISTESQILGNADET